MILYIKVVGGYLKVVEDIFELMFRLALRVQYGFTGIKVDVEFEKPELRSEIELAQWLAIAIKNVTAMYDEQAIGDKEKRQRLRELGKFRGPVPNDALPERRVTQTQVNDAERPTRSEEEKENKRAETNKQRRSGSATTSEE
jgi:hypothetical protein